MNHDYSNKDYAKMQAEKELASYSTNQIKEIAQKEKKSFEFCVVLLFASAIISLMCCLYSLRENKISVTIIPTIIFLVDFIFMIVWVKKI